MLLQSKDPSSSANVGRSFEIFAFKPILVNDKPITSKDKLVKVKNLDRIQFPCDLCPIPHVYHLIIPEGDPVQTEQNHFNAQVFKPLLAKYPQSAHKLRSFIEMMMP